MGNHLKNPKNPIGCNVQISVPGFSHQDARQPANDQHRKSKFKGIGHAVLICFIQQCRGFAVEWQHINMLDEESHRQCQAKNTKAKTIGHTNGDGHKNHGAHGFALED